MRIESVKSYFYRSENPVNRKKYIELYEDARRELLWEIRASEECDNRQRVKRLQRAIDELDAEQRIFSKRKK